MTDILGILIALAFVIGLPGILLYILLKWVREFMGLSAKELKYKAGQTLDMGLALAIAVVLITGITYLISNKIISADLSLIMLAATCIIIVSFVIYRVYKRENARAIQEGRGEPLKTRNERNTIIKFCALMMVMVFATQAIPTYALIIIAICLALRYLYQKYSSKWREKNREPQVIAKSLPEMLNTKAMTLLLFSSILGAIVSHELMSIAAPDKNLKLCNELDKTNLDVNIQACTDLINKGTANPIVYLKRSAANLSKGLIDEATQDINRSLNIAPNNYPAHAVRGMIYLAQGRYEDAIHDMDIAIQSNYTKDDKAISSLLRTRGIAELYALSLEPAINDLRASLRNDLDSNSRSFGIIILHIARARAGQDDKEFKVNSDSLAQGKWPAPLMALYRGEGTVEEVFSKAKDGNATEQADQMCDANFYTAEFYLLQNMKEKAQPLFEAAKDNCPKTAFERSFAQTELKLLHSKIQ